MDARSLHYYLPSLCLLLWLVSCICLFVTYPREKVETSSLLMPCTVIFRMCCCLCVCVCSSLSLLEYVSCQCLSCFLWKVMHQNHRSGSLVLSVVCCVFCYCVRPCYVSCCCFCWHVCVVAVCWIIVIVCLVCFCVGWHFVCVCVCCPCLLFKCC